MMKRLVLVRHGDALQRGSPDRDRPLSPQGKDEALCSAHVFASRAFEVDLMLTSPARRALETARIFAGALCYPAQQIRTEERIYAADQLALERLLRALDDELDHVMLIGHLPGVLDLAASLAGPELDRFPTAAVAVLESPTSSWSRCATTRVSVRDFITPSSAPV